MTVGDLKLQLESIPDTDELVAHCWMTEEELRGLLAGAKEVGAGSNHKMNLLLRPVLGIDAKQNPDTCWVNL